MKKVKLLIALFSILCCMSLITACDSSDNNKTLGNSQDNSSVNKAGGSPITDTATINKARRDSTQSSTAKGNADPTGHQKNQ